MRDYYDGEPGNSIRDGQVEFVSEYAKECRKIGAKVLAQRTKNRKGSV